MSVVVGVDVAKRSFDIATPLPNGKVRTKAKLANNPSGFEQFATWLEQHAEPRAWVITVSYTHLTLPTNREV